jgi:hypothetical protein
MGFLAIGAGDGVGLGADVQRDGAHQASVFQLGEDIIKFTKAFRDLFAQLLVNIDQFDHPGGAARSLAVSASAQVASNIAGCRIDAGHRGLDPGKRGCNTIGVHGVNRYQQNAWGAKA